MSISAAGIVSDGTLEIAISDEGSIQSVRDTSNKIFTLDACTLVGGMRVGKTEVRIVDASRARITRQLRGQKGQGGLLVETISVVNGIGRWNVKFESFGPLFSAPLVSRIRSRSGKGAKFWTAWSDPSHRNRGWRNPLEPQVFREGIWTYSNLGHFTPEHGDFVSIPLAMISEPAANAGITFGLSPEDNILDVRIRTRRNGAVSISRRNHRMGEGCAVEFSLVVGMHSADWRGSLKMYSSLYPEYFEPVNKLADEMAGCGAYSGYEGAVDADCLRKMAFRVNWKLSDDFPWMGMFLPPVKDADEAWTRSCDEPVPGDKPSKTSCRRMNDYARYMRKNGFYVLNYFNVTEFGKNMRSTAKEGVPVEKPWLSPRQFLRGSFPEAVLDTRLRTFYGAFVMDCGDKRYMEFLLEQAKRHVSLLPDTSGICIDRMDWLRHYNVHADDGVSMVKGRPARALVESWKRLLERLGPLMHEASKVIFANPMTMRVDLMRNVDGFFSEHGESGPGLNSMAFLALRKTAITWTCMWWTRPVHDLKPDPDRFFQRHLFMGVFPVAPYPYNNHALRPHPETDRWYLEYGPLLELLRGKKWVLEPDCVSCKDGKALVNIFCSGASYVIPVVFGAGSGEAEVCLRNLTLREAQGARVYHPGENNPEAVPLLRDGDSFIIRVPLKRGCGILTVEKSYGKQ